MHRSGGATRAPRPTRGREVLLVAGAFLLVVVGLELGVRLFDPQPTNRYRWSPDCGYEPVPGAAFVYRRSEFEIPIRYNAAGMRDRERREATPPGAARVALLGDSQVESKEVPFDSTFGARLEHALGGKDGAPAVEILNFGVSGYGTVATLARFHVLGRRFDPDLVVYVFMDNDVDDNLNRDRSLFEMQDGSLHLRRLPDGWRTRTARRGLDVVRHRLQSYAFLKFRVLELRSRGAARAARASAAPVDRAPAWEVLRLALRALDAETRATGAALLVVQAGASAETAARLAETCALEAIPYFDLRPALASGGRGLWFEIDGHWRAPGHAVAARALAPVLEASLAAAGAAPQPGGPGNAPPNARATK